MKKITALLLVFTLSTGCGLNKSSDSSVPESQPVTYQEQSPGQLGLPQESGYVPVNYRHTVGQWFPYMLYEEDMRGRTADEFRSAVRERYAAAKADGVNTVYLHVHPFCDAYYKSEIFPYGSALTGDYDPLGIMLEEAHKLGLSAHAWLNPLRCQSTEEMKELPDSFIVKQWADDPDCNIAAEINGRWYLDPAYGEVDELLAGCITEIAENYDVDGFQIDDYFYPTTDTWFDEKEFAESGADDLAKWRMSNCTRMVKAMYSAVKAADTRLEFGISPQGSINGNYNSQYADVRLWCGSEGYCDYIVPQLYFGFNNAANPFAETLAQWEEMCSDRVRLIIGLAEYKVGKSDKWAGAAGENEWIDDPDIIKRQKELAESSSASGYALYR